MITSFQDLEVWQKAHRLTLAVFDLTEQWPKNYTYDLIAQVRRAALSIPTNLAEGCATAYTKELLQFVNISRRSVSEVQYLIFFAFERRLISGDSYLELKRGYEEIGRMLSGLNNSLKRRRSHYSLTTSH